MKDLESKTQSLELTIERLSSSLAKSEEQGCTHKDKVREGKGGAGSLDTMGRKQTGVWEEYSIHWSSGSESDVVGIRRHELGVMDSHEALGIN